MIYGIVLSIILTGFVVWFWCRQGCYVSLLTKNVKNYTDIPPKEGYYKFNHWEYLKVYKDNGTLKVVPCGNNGHIGTAHPPITYKSFKYELPSLKYTATNWKIAIDTHSDTTNNKNQWILNKMLNNQHFTRYETDLYKRPIYAISIRGEIR